MDRLRILLATNSSTLGLAAMMAVVAVVLIFN